jgi:D-alanine-D-alanine ligase
MKIALLKGGLSSEREVSLKTAASVAKALKNITNDVVEIDVGHDLPQKLAEAKPDLAFIALHGTYGEDGCVQGLLEFMKIPYTHSSITTSAIAMNKELTQKLLAASGIKCAKNVCGSIDEINFNVLPTPFVLKPVAEGSSVGVSIIKTEDDFKKAKADWKYGKAIAEEYIAGRELSVAVLDNPKPTALGVIELRPKAGFYTYENKYTDGKTEHLMPAPLIAAETEAVKDMAVKAHIALGCSGASRSDFRFDGKNFYILEVNTHPGMTELSLLPEIAAYSGISFAKVIETLVKNAKLHNIKS